MGSALSSHYLLMVFPSVCPLHQPQFLGLISGLWHTWQPGSFCPPAKLSFTKQTHTDSNRWIF